MSPRQVELALKRQRLQLKAASQRQTVVEELGRLAPVFAFSDRVQAGYLYLKRHPEWVVGSIVVLLVVRPRIVMRWARRGYVLWRISRRLRRGLDNLQASSSRP